MEPKRYWIREPFSGLSHGAGALLSVVGLIALLVLARGRPWLMAGFAMYGASLIALYTASALYHSLHVSARGLHRLMLCDHGAIFLLIAGTYAPLCLGTLRAGWGPRLLLMEYGLAAIGIGCVFLFNSKPEWLRVVLYLGMGWLALLALPALRAPAAPGRARLADRRRRTVHGGNHLLRHQSPPPVARQIRRARPVARFRAGGQCLSFCIDAVLSLMLFLV